MKPRVLLINPPLTGKIEAGITNVKVPLGMAYIAAVIEELGYEVQILDSMADWDVIEQLPNGDCRVGTSLKEIRKHIENYKPNIVGIHCAYTAYEADSLTIAKMARETVPKGLIIFGGAHASASKEKLLSKHKDVVDIIVFGEAEYTFREIVQKYDSGESIEDVKGTVVKNGNTIKTNPERPFIFNLDELPMPARHLLRMDRYLKHPLSAIGTYRSPVTDMITSRGCPQSCTFCSIFTVWKRTWRQRSANKVVDEIEHLIKTYGVRQIRIQDDNFGVNKRRVIEICDEIIKRGLDIKWDTPNGIGIWTLTEDLLEKMAKAGYVRAGFGIETGSPKTLKNHIRKPIDYEHAKKIIKKCNELGIWTASTFIIGFPEETMEDIRMTIDFAKNSGLDFALFYVAQPYKGTPLYDQYEQEELLTEPIGTSSSINTQYKTHHFTAEQLQKIQQDAQREFIRYKVKQMANPLYSAKWIKQKIRGYEDLKHVIKMTRNLLPLQHISFANKKKR